MALKRQYLRPYQAHGICAWQESGSSATVMVLPTGAGKTSIASSCLSDQMNVCGRGIMLAHRNELIDQAAQRLCQYGVESEIVRGADSGIDWTRPMLTGTVQTLIRRLERLANWARGEDVLVFSDETHRVLGPTQRTVINTIRGVAKRFRLIGLTATPYRLDGQGLGVDYGGVFDNLIEAVTPTFLFDNGQCSNCKTEHVRGALCCGMIVRSYLMRPRLFQGQAVDTTGIKAVGGDFDHGEVERRSTSIKLVGDIVDQYRRLADGRVGVIFGVGVKHANMISDSFNTGFVSGPAFTGQVKICDVVTGETDAMERDLILSRLAIGDLKLVASVSVMSEGWDPESDFERALRNRGLWRWNASRTQRVEPKYVPLTVAIDACPTQSMGKFMQGPIGRNTRNHPDKDEALYLGHADNIDRHCQPDQHHGFDLSGFIEKKDKNQGAAKKSVAEAIVVCTACFSTWPGGTVTCKDCGRDLSKGRKIETVQGDLHEVKHKIGEGLSAGEKTTAAKEARFREWVAECRRNNQAPTIADRRFKDQFAAWPERGMKERVYREFGFSRYLFGA